MRTLSSILPLMALAAVAAAQPREEELLFRAVTSDVQVDALVKYQGGYLRDLKQEDFIILDEKQPRATEAFEEASVPLDLVFVIESGAFFHPPEYMARVATRVTEGLRSSDRAAVVWEDPDKRETIYNHLRLTPKPEEVAAALKVASRKPKTPASGGDTTFSLHWAAWMIEDELRKRPPKERRKQAILLIRNVSLPSGLPGDPLVQHLWSINTPLYAILLPYRLTELVGGTLSYRSDNPVYLAQQTGGEVMWTDQQGNLDQLPEFIRNIQSSYSLWFKAAQGEAGTVRHVSVQLSDAAKKKYPGAQVLARQGYIVP